LLREKSSAQPRAAAVHELFLEKHFSDKKLQAGVPGAGLSKITQRLKPVFLSALPQA
jgi:hypothetical protein